jgi:hypothetical protein
MFTLLAGPDCGELGSILVMNVLHDGVKNGWEFQVLTVICKWHRARVAMQADFALTGQSVVNALEDVAAERDRLYAITVDHGTDLSDPSMARYEANA